MCDKCNGKKWYWSEDYWFRVMCPCRHNKDMTYTDEQKARLFDALIADGVDNWDGYQERNFQETIKSFEIENLIGETIDELQDLFEMLTDGSTLEVEYPAGREAGSAILFTKGGEERVAKFIIEKYKYEN